MQVVEKQDGFTESTASNTDQKTEQTPSPTVRRDSLHGRTPPPIISVWCAACHKIPLWGDLFIHVSSPNAVHLHLGNGEKNRT